MNREQKAKKTRYIFLCIIHDFVLAFAYIPFKNYVNEWGEKPICFAKKDIERFNAMSCL